MNKIKFFIIRMLLHIKPFPEYIRPKYDSVDAQLKQLWRRLFSKKIRPDFQIGDNVTRPKDIKKENITPYLSNQPLILTIENTSDKAIENVEILAAAKRYIQGYSHEIKGIKVEYFFYFSYGEFLMHLFSYQYIIGMTRISFTHEGEKIEIGDLLFTITEKEMIGRIVSRPFIPKIEPESFHSTVADINQKFRLDCLTSLVFNKIPAKTIIHLNFFPLLRKANGNV